MQTIHCSKSWPTYDNHACHTLVWFFYDIHATIHHHIWLRICLLFLSAGQLMFSVCQHFRSNNPAGGKKWLIWKSLVWCFSSMHIKWTHLINSTVTSRAKRSELDHQVIYFYSALLLSRTDLRIDRPGKFKASTTELSVCHYLRELNTVKIMKLETHRSICDGSLFRALSIFESIWHFERLIGPINHFWIIASVGCFKLILRLFKILVAKMKL